MVNRMLLSPLIVAWCLSLASTIQAQSSTSTTGSSIDIHCYDFDGRSELERNQQCFGSQTCCTTRDRCLPNKMCLNDGVLVRPLSAVYPWSNETCSPLCLFATRFGSLPRILMCPDGSYCCNNDALCCAKGNGKFVGPDGNLISNPYTTAASINFALTSTTFAPTSTFFAPTSITFTPTPTNTTTVGAQGTPTAVESGSGGLSTIAKGAIGALAGVLLLTVIAAGFFIWRKRREVSSLKPISSAEIQPVGQQYHYQHPDGSFFAPGAEAGYRRAELGSDPIPAPELPSEPSATSTH